LSPEIFKDEVGHRFCAEPDNRMPIAISNASNNCMRINKWGTVRPAPELEPRSDNRLTVHYSVFDLPGVANGQKSGLETVWRQTTRNSEKQKPSVSTSASACYHQSRTERQLSEKPTIHSSGLPPRNSRNDAQEPFNVRGVNRGWERLVRSQVS